MSFVERDWFDWASLIFNTLATSAGLVGLFIAVRAYRIAKRQNRYAFESILLKELLDIAENREFMDRLMKHGLETISEFQIKSRLDLLPPDYLPTWRTLYEHVMRYHGVARPEVAEIIWPMRHMPRPKEMEPRRIQYALRTILSEEVRKELRKQLYGRAHFRGRNRH